jgi:hypothetical protein
MRDKSLDEARAKDWGFTVEDYAIYQDRVPFEASKLYKHVHTVEVASLQIDVVGAADKRISLAKNISDWIEFARELDPVIDQLLSF